MPRMVCPLCNLKGQVFHRLTRSQFPLEWVCRRCGHEWSTRTDYKDAYNTACEHRRYKRYEESVKFLRWAFRLNPPQTWPDFNQALHCLALDLYELGRFRDAVTECQKLAERHPRFHGSYLIGGRAYSRLDRLDEALLHFQKAKALAPENPWIYFEEGLVRREQGNVHEAIKVWEEGHALKQVREELKNFQNAGHPHGVSTPLHWVLLDVIQKGKNTLLRQQLGAEPDDERLNMIHPTDLGLECDQYGLRYIGPWIGDLTMLRELTLNGNPQDSHLHRWSRELGLTELPPEIGKLTNLTKLDLSHNNLTELPPEIGNLTSLTHLDLSYNRLYELPPEMGNLTSLTYLDLSYNRLNEKPEPGDELLLAEKRMKGKLREGPFKWFMESLWVRRNKKPPEIENLVNLTTLKRSYSSLSAYLYLMNEYG